MAEIIAPKESEPQPKRYVWVLSILLILFLIFIVATCEPRPDTSPLLIQAIDPIPGVLGYFAFPVAGGGSLSGTLALYQELRTGDDSVLASRVYTIPLSVQNVTANMITHDSHVAEDWAVTLNDDAFEWSTAYWYVGQPHGEVVLIGVWYTDFDTPTQSGPDGAYLTREISVFRLFLPVIMK